MSTGQAPARRGGRLQEVAVDFDLDALLPPARTIRHRGVVYSLPGDPPVDFMIAALQVSRDYQQSQATGDEVAAMNVLEQMREMLDALVAAEPANEGLPPLRMGSEGMLSVFVIAMGGDPTEVSLEQLAQQAYSGEGPEDEPDVPLDEEGSVPPTSPETQETPAEGAPATPAG